MCIYKTIKKLKIRTLFQLTPPGTGHYAKGFWTLTFIAYRTFTYIYKVCSTSSIILVEKLQFLPLARWPLELGYASRGFSQTITGIFCPFSFLNQVSGDKLPCLLIEKLKICRHVMHYGLGRPADTFNHVGNSPLSTKHEITFSLEFQCTYRIFPPALQRGTCFTGDRQGFCLRIFDINLIESDLFQPFSKASGYRRKFWSNAFHVIFCLRYALLAVIIIINHDMSKTNFPWWNQIRSIFQIATSKNLEHFGHDPFDNWTKYGQVGFLLLWFPIS